MKLPFKKRSTKLPFSNFAEYYIGADVIATGTCRTDQDVYIDGQYDGQLHTTGLIELAKNSNINADITARTAIIEGSFKGNAVVSDELRISSCATIKGKLSTANLIVDKGAILQTQIMMEKN